MKLPISKPSTAAANKTGDWKTFKPVVDPEKCIKCGICQRFCPEGIMGKEGTLSTPDLDYCKGCGICANECPKKAITMVEEKTK